MTKPLKFLIIDGYSRESRDNLAEAGMQFAWKLYVSMLNHHLSKPTYDIWLPSDEDTVTPSEEMLAQYHGILWTGCNLCVNDIDNPSVKKQIELAKLIFEIGTPSFGSCWGLQIAVVAAGGEVIENPKGREMGIARKIQLTKAAYNHPMFDRKTTVFDAFISHDDIVSKYPEEAILLAGNDFTAVQAMEVKHKKGTFWATQYHPEYDLHEMASLIIAREEKLIDLGFFKGHDDMADLVNRMKELSNAPNRKDLRWQLAIDDDVLDQNIRQCEFANWINHQVLPTI